MEAIIFDKKSATLKYEKKRTIPCLINDNDVIVKVEYSGICGTDLHIVEVCIFIKSCIAFRFLLNKVNLQGAFPCDDKKPFVLGHEFCGIIESAGPKAHFRPGQRVVVDPNRYQTLFFHLIFFQ